MAEDTEPSRDASLRALGQHPRADDLARLVQAAAFSAFEERRSALHVGLDEAAARLGLDEASSDTELGNVIRALRSSGPLSRPERQLLGALLARSIGLSPPEEGEASLRVAEALGWIAAHTPVDPLPFLDRGLGAAAQPLWSALVLLLERYDDGRAGSFDRPAAIVTASAIGRSEAPVCEQHRAALRVALRDVTLLALVGQAPEALATKSVLLSAEETGAPRSALATFLLTVTFVLPLVAGARLFARFALGFRRPAEANVSREGVRIKSRTILLGRTILERETFLPTAGLARARREVRYPRLPVYVGIAALLAGSYVGLRLFVDGVRSASPELIGLGVGVLLLGLGLDYALSLWPARSSDRCRVFLQPRKGRGLSLRDVDRELADKALGLLAAK